MADIVNLRLARKARARTDAAVQADANRRKFGRTIAEKQRDDAVRAHRDRILDGAKREDD